MVSGPSLPSPGSHRIWKLYVAPGYEGWASPIHWGHGGFSFSSVLCLTRGLCLFSPLPFSLFSNWNLLTTTKSIYDCYEQKAAWCTLLVMWASFQLPLKFSSSLRKQSINSYFSFPLSSYVWVSRQGSQYRTLRWDVTRSTWRVFPVLPAWNWRQPSPGTMFRCLILITMTGLQSCGLWCL